MSEQAEVQSEGLAVNRERDLLGLMAQAAPRGGPHKKSLCIQGSVVCRFNLQLLQPVHSKARPVPPDGWSRSLYHTGCHDPTLALGEFLLFFFTGDYLF